MCYTYTHILADSRDESKKVKRIIFARVERVIVNVYLRDQRRWEWREERCSM